jgi:uncharacterized protein YcfJ
LFRFGRDCFLRGAFLGAGLGAGFLGLGIQGSFCSVKLVRTNLRRCESTFDEALSSGKSERMEESGFFWKLRKDN